MVLPNDLRTSCGPSRCVPALGYVPLSAIGGQRPGPEGGAHPARRLHARVRLLRGRPPSRKDYSCKMKVTFRRTRYSVIFPFSITIF
jgi:hypothetical protein